MAQTRYLSPDEAALWRRVVQSVNPIDPGKMPASAPAPAPSLAARVPLVPPAATPKTLARAVAAKAPPAPPVPGTTLDGGWDRRLSSGRFIPDTTVDLHGHTLDTAYQLLDRRLDQAIRRGDRVLLLITGKPPRPESERPHARGRIRAAVGDWLAASRHAGDIAAVRGAHPRHGGNGALYIVLRRSRSAPKY